MKKTFRFIIQASIVLIILLLVYLLAAFCLSRITVNKESNSNAEIGIFIMTNGVHTDLVVPIYSDLYDWSQEVIFANTISKDSNQNYLAMGWGDKGFYLETPKWRDLKASIAIKAAFGLGKTAIHATFYETLIVGERCKKIWISKEQYSRLVGFIVESFQKDENGHFINIKTTAVYGQNDAFYEAKGSYSMFYTCNTWANNGLKICGQKCCLWTPFDSGIFSKYK